MKAIALLSGGLDSRLAVKLMQEQGIELEAVNFVTIFCTCTSKNKGCSEAVSAAREFNIPLKVFNVTEEFLGLVEHPRFGYGSGMNPCLDCRVLMFKRAKEYMLMSKASFIVTGEVLGERPMSQRGEAIRRIELESGLDGLILRPLSAKLFEPSVPEREGWVKREKLLDIKGKSRKPQIKLASEFCMNDYPCPAGGCLLTDKEVSKRVRDLIDHKQWNLKSARLLRYGRHFRVSPSCKAVVGRKEEENIRIKNLKTVSDILFEVKDCPGPVTLLKGKILGDEINLVAKLTAHFVKKREEAGKVAIEISHNSYRRITKVSPLRKEEVGKYKINK